MKSIGILGGTFDPPHIGHLIIANDVCHAQQLDEVWFMPSYEPPHKESAAADTMDRVAMLERVTADNPLFKVETTEVNRLGKSFTFDTMKWLQEAHPDTSFYFIIGADMVENLPRWRHIEQLLEMVTFVGVNRKGYTINSHYAIRTMDVPLMEISSTAIKNRVRSEKTIKYMVPESVETYIKENRLYE
ncbi:nicotinate-nucleotide adenylyltransferase [Barrientosiimonas marina]|uniref:Probable nicotinate-nucleotide adenylyltransferase n=1 Tax=Lentibacillus kimchii TaxID=1542911 RepID=A0ABW2UXR7_9BACI